MRDVDAESDRATAVAVFVPMRDDVADQFGAIHAVGELVLDIVASDGVHAGQDQDRSARKCGCRLGIRAQ